jgi:cytochrome P450
MGPGAQADLHVQNRLKRFLVTSDVEIALSALRDRPGRFRRLSTIEPVAAEMGINGVFSVEGEAWRPQRNLVTRALAPHQLESFFPTVQLISDRLRRRWHKAWMPGPIPMPFRT